MTRPPIRQDIAPLVKMHDTILKSLQAQKVRHDMLFEHGVETVSRELGIPANVHSRWATLINPFVEEVRSGKLADVDLITAMKQFIKDLIKYEQNYVISDAAISHLEVNFDQVVETVLLLEKALVDKDRDVQEAALMRHLEVIKTYQQWYPYDIQARKGHCTYCGVALTEDAPSATSCALCHAIPADRRPYVRIGQAIVPTSALSEPAAVAVRAPQGRDTVRGVPAHVEPERPAVTVVPVREMLKQAAAVLPKKPGKPGFGRPKQVTNLLNRVDQVYKEDIAALETGDDDEDATEDDEREEVPS